MPSKYAHIVLLVRCQSQGYTTCLHIQVLQSDLNTQIFEDLVQFVEKAQDGFVAGEGCRSRSTEIPTAALVTGILWYYLYFLYRFIPFLFCLSFGLGPICMLSSQGGSSSEYSEFSKP